MWGNALGWTISFLLVILTAAGITWLDHTARSQSSKTVFSRSLANADAIELPVSPKTFFPAMTDPTDAAPVYREAIEQFQQQPYVYERFARDGRLRDVDTVPAIDTLLKATHYASANLFQDNPAEIVNYDNEKPALDALRTLGACARRAGQLIESDHPDRAVQLFEATFSLGDKLYRERLIYAEMDAGLTMMAESATLIGLGDPYRAAAAKQFNDARKNYFAQRIAPALRVITSADQNVLEEHAGDVVYFSEYAGDRMWRVE